MSAKVQEKFDRILENVKDPESSLPLSDLGVVEKFRYHEEGKKIYVFTKFQSHRPSCMTCVGISLALEKSIDRLIEEELQKEFPGFSVEFLSF
jgi:metal-sulfur cluster biosynthetic enzyme